MLDVQRSLEQHPHVKRPGLRPDDNDAWQVGNTLAQLLPVDELVKYQLLQLDDVEEFMARTDAILNELGGFGSSESVRAAFCRPEHGRQPVWQ